MVGFYSLEMDSLLKPHPVKMDDGSLAEKDTCIIPNPDFLD